MTINSLLKEARLKLKTSTTSASLDSEVLLSFCLGKPREYLLTYPQLQVAKKIELKFATLVKNRISGQPVAYLVGRKEFYGFDFKVNKNVLVPRPETEMLVEEAISMLSTGQTVADIGTGSGCIAVSLAKLRPDIKVIASDISSKALGVAKENAKINKVKIKFSQGDLLQPLMRKKIDLIVANLPYGQKAWKNNTSINSSSLRHEPATALFTSENGLYHYRRLFEQINLRRKKPQCVICEFDPRQSKIFRKLASKYFANSEISIKKDLSGKNRILIIRDL